MFCLNCGAELKEKSNFCTNCGYDLSELQDKLPEEPETEYEEYDEEEYEEDKIQDLIDIITSLQEEKEDLRIELEECRSRQRSPVSRSKSEYIESKKPKPVKEKKDAISRFRKWYNE